MIAIIGATFTETAGLIHDMKISRQITGSLPFFYEGQLGELNIILVLSGIGKKNASNAIRALMKSYSFNALLSIGVAGGVDPVLEIGDVVLGRQILSLNSNNEKLVSDRQLLDSAIETCKKLNKRYFIGNILTVPKMITLREKKAEIYQKYRPLAVESETYYVAREAAQIGIPFLSIRAISDKAEQSIKIDFENIKRGALQKGLYFLRHPTAYFRLLRLNRDITKTASHLSPIISKTLINFASIME